MAYNASYTIGAGLMAIQDNGFVRMEYLSPTFILLAANI
jgi:hypothetical protein